MGRFSRLLFSLAVACSLSFPAHGADAHGDVFRTLGGHAAGASALSPSADASGWGNRLYESDATGAPRAKERTETTLGALADAARNATDGSGFGDLVGADAVPRAVRVAQFGAYGDGAHDDSAALQAAFSSGAETILFERGARYKVNRSLKISRSGVTVLGNSATIFTDADYDDDGEWLLSVTGKLPEQALRDTVADDWGSQGRYFIENVGIYQLNLEARSYDPASAAIGKKAYSKQLMVQMAGNVDIFGCTFTIERPGSGRTVDGCTALDAYTGWHDLTVENCIVRDFCDKESGGGMWIRDHFNMGASNIVVKGNDFEKACHDEILAVWNTNEGKAGVTARRITDVLVVENRFVLDEATASPSVMAFRVGCARDVLMENNHMEAKTTGGMVWSADSSGITVRGNDIAQTRSHVEGATNFLMFRGDIDLIEDNRVALAALDGTAARNDVYAFSTNGVVRGNTVVSDMELDYVASGSDVVEGNDMRLNARVHVVFNANRVVKGNKVELLAHADQYFQYYRTVLAQDADLSGNAFANMVEGDVHTVLMLNEATMGGHVIRFSGNALSSAGIGPNARLLFLKLLDEAPQENCVVLSGNDIPDLETYGIYRPDARHTYLFAAEGDGQSGLGGNGEAPAAEDESSSADDAPDRDGGGEADMGAGNATGPVGSEAPGRIETGPSPSGSASTAAGEMPDSAGSAAPHPAPLPPPAPTQFPLPPPTPLSPASTWAARS